MNQLLLGIDTATAETSVALARVDLATGSVEQLAEATHSDARRHGEVLPLLIAQVLSDAGHRAADVEAVVVGVGPGAYTGLRVGIATAVALGQTLAIPVFGAVTVDAIAFQCALTTPFVVVTDARRREYYLAGYDDYRTPHGRPSVAGPEAVVAAASGSRGVVVAPVDTPRVPGVEFVTTTGPRASAICAVVADRLQRGLPTEPVHALYLRRPDVSVAQSAKSVLS
jgi:tRNA threonylcarbamoyl adenosine modification protein YeaZ